MLCFAMCTNIGYAIDHNFSEVLHTHRMFFAIKIYILIKLFASHGKIIPFTVHTQEKIKNNFLR